MKSRMEKYYDNSNNIGSRSKKNEDLYKEINNSDIDRFEINSNATVIAESTRNIDVEQIKKILDNKYKSAPKRRSIVLDNQEEEQDFSIEQTKEYDINAILEKAREHKESDYEKDRLKKLRDTQFDILSKLNLDKEEKEEIEEEPENKDLMTLIDVINNNSKKEEKLEGSADPLDILTDLKGDENTQTIAGLKEAINSIQEEKEVKEEKKIDNSFYTESVNFTESDFDDFNDLKKEVNSHKVLIRIVIAFIAVAVLAGLFICLNMLFDWGLFS